MKSPSRQYGVTLIELIVSIVILGIAATGILMVITQTTRHSADPMLREQAVAIAQSYMDEILLHPLGDPDGVSGETDRGLFDDVWDYHGTSDDGARDQNGTAIPGLEPYNVSVAIDDTGVTLGGSPATYVSVRVTHDASTAVDIPLGAYRLN